MTKMAPDAMAKTLAQGLLSFPVTHFDAEAPTEMADRHANDVRFALHA